MVRHLLAAAAALCVCSIHAEPSQAHHQQLGTLSGELRECFERNMVSPQFNSDTERAVQIIAKMVGYDAWKLQAAENVSYLYTTATPQLCHQVESKGYDLQTTARNMVTGNNESSRRFNDQVQAYAPGPVQKPIYCNRIGTMTMCN